MKCQRKNCTRKAIRPGNLCTPHYQATPHGFVDSTQCRERVQALRAAGYGWVELSRLTGLSGRALRLAGQWTDQRTVCLDTHERIMAVPVPDTIVDGGALLPALGTQRRIKALMAIGWTQVRMAEMLNWTQRGISWTLRREQVTAAKAADIAALYEKLHMQRGPSELIIKRAKKWGWYPPLAWTDIDDPDEVPSLGEATVIPFPDRYREVREIESHPERIAKRLGMSTDSLERMLTRHRLKGAS